MEAIFDTILWFIAFVVLKIFKVKVEFGDVRSQIYGGILGLCVIAIILVFIFS
jgi:hypothetical protein